MSAAAERVAAGALACVGARFRAQGREAATGLDCVGVALVALAAADVRVRAPDDYQLRTGAWAIGEVAGLTRCDGAALGDVLLCRSAPHQLHVAVRVEDGVVHADAGLRRVVRRPGAVPWPIVAAWRIGEEG